MTLPEHTDVTMQLRKDTGGQKHSGNAQAYGEGNDCADEHMVLDESPQQQYKARPMLSLRPGLSEALGIPGDLNDNGGAV